MSMEVVAPPFTEIWKCEITQLENTRSMPINRAESRTTPGMHHQTVTVLTGLPGLEDIEHGIYDCRELYDAHPELMENAIQLYGSQDAEQSIDLGDATANLPPRLVVMHEVHYLNSVDEETLVQSYVNAYAIPPSEADKSIWGVTVRDTNLAIPARGTTVEWTRCEMSSDVELKIMASHTHELGVRVTAYRWDGSEVGERIYENDDWHTPKLEFYDAVPIAAGTGFHFECEFDNPREEDVAWGFNAEDEMCQITLVFTPGLLSTDCEVVDSSDGLH